MKFIRSFINFSAWLVAVGHIHANAAPHPAVTSVPFLNSGQNSPDHSGFVRLAPSDTGLTFTTPIDTSHPKKLLYVGGYAVGGIAIGDVDGDSLPDLFCAGGPVPNALFRQLPTDTNTRAPRFHDATAESGLSTPRQNPWSAGAAFADIDNDGDLDLYVTHYDSPNSLYINQRAETGHATFIERASEFGLAVTDASFTPSFADYDRDGDLDLYLIGYQYKNPAGRPATPPVSKVGDRYIVDEPFQKYYGIVPGDDGKPTFRNTGRNDYLFRNDGGKFADVTESAGITDVGVGNSSLWWDFNADGWPDLFVANDFKAPDALYLNNKDGTFRDVSKITFSHTTWFSMGSDAGDVNNDGRIDLLVSDMAGSTHYRAKVTMGDMGSQTTFLATAEPRQFMRNALFINTGTPRFLEAAYMAGIAKSDWTWATKLLDLDGDGWLDVFFTNGAARMFNHSDLAPKNDLAGTTEWDRWENTPPRTEENLAFRNTGTGLEFENTSARWSLDHKGMSYAAAHADLDLDGDLDLVVANLDEPVSIYLNHLPKSNHVRFVLHGTKSNRSGIGATIKIETSSGQQQRQLNPYTGFLSSNAHAAHFGLGAIAKVDLTTITWPSGVVQQIPDLQAGHTHTITEPDESSAAPPPTPPSPPLFAPSPKFPAIRFNERPYDDYARQPLLPYQHSQLGASIAVADVDNDGDDDYYFARPAGSPRGIYIAGSDGSYQGSSVPTFNAHIEHEDMGCLFFDADSDGDPDLYVVSGSVECDPGAPVLADRLYLNDGHGNFTSAPATCLPDRQDSGSTVTAADFDRDGDLDLFVGGRVIPGRYPEAPDSTLLENRSTKSSPKFVDITARTPGLRNTGLVTAALWTDVDNDTWPDLLVAHEWGPVKLYHNNQGSLSEASDTGISELTGWWNGLDAADIDNDGDIDFVATNFGLNTAYHAAPDHPALLYYGDFDGTGKPHLVEAKDKDGKLLPWRGLSCSSSAMPFIRKKLPTFDAFGRASLGEIYTAPALENAIVRRAIALETTLFVNHSETGAPKFKPVPLPRLAQISPSFGVNLFDADGDTLTDCFLAQNFHSPQLEVGRMDSGLSLLLLGTGAGFTPAWPRSSGISIRGDAMGSVVSDYNRDGSPDLLVAVNNGILQAHDNATRNHLAVSLLGLPGNIHATGARLTLEFTDPSAPTLTAEIHTGSSYLSQSAPTVFFGRANFTPKSVTVRWPGATTSVYPIPAGATSVRLPHPGL